jgi:hypothetical protein
VAVEQSTHVDSTARQATVHQQLRYRIAYEPLDALVLNVPRGFLRMKDLSLKCDGEDLELDALVTEDTERDDDLIELRVPLSSARLGTCEVAIQYTAPVDRASRDEAAKIMLPLAVPVSGEPAGDDPGETFVFRGHVLAVDLPNGTRLQTLDAPWAALDNAAGEADQGNRFSAEQPVPQVQLNLVFGGARGAEVTLVRQAWIQPWLTPTSRRDRASFRVRTAARQIQLRLPEGADLAKADLFVNGMPVATSQVGELEVLIELNGQFGQREYLVEVWYPFARPRPHRGAISLGLPQVVHADWIERMYLQVVLPPDEQLVGTPSAMTSEMSWGWRGVRWGSQPQLSTGELETWMDTAWACDVPAGANLYLFSRFGALETVNLHTASRSRIVLIASGVLLVAGLLWIYVPLIRRAWVLLLAVCAFGFVAAAYPEPAVFGAQAAAVGLALVVAARLMHWAIVERRMSRAVVHGTSMATADRSTTETQLRPPPGSSHRGSATVPATSSVPVPDP